MQTIARPYSVGKSAAGAHTWECARASRARPVHACSRGANFTADPRETGCSGERGKGDRRKGWRAHLVGRYRWASVPCVCARARLFIPRTRLECGSSYLANLFSLLSPLPPFSLSPSFTLPTSRTHTVAINARVRLSSARDRRSSKPQIVGNRIFPQPRRTVAVLSLNLVTHVIELAGHFPKRAFYETCSASVITNKQSCDPIRVKAACNGYRGICGLK